MLFANRQLAPEKPNPGPQASLSRSEVMTLALFGQWMPFPSERTFSRYAQQHLRDACAAAQSEPVQSAGAQASRRDHGLCLFLVQMLHAPETANEVLDSMAAVTRDAKRRGTGSLVGQADIGWSHRSGWEEGFHLLRCVTGPGVRTGFGFASASTHDQHVAATLFATRHIPSPRLPSAGSPAHGSSVAEQGFAGDRPQRQGKQPSQVELVTPPHQSSRQRWANALRWWLASVRHIIETVNDKRLNTFRLARERPHDMAGFHARLAATVALHNFGIWFNIQRDETPFAFAAFLAW